MTLRRSVASLWIATVLYWPMQVIVSRSWTTPYSWRDDVISALGAATCTDYCSPDHVVMNATFVAVGGATAAGAALLVRPSVGIARTGWILVALSGLATCAVGFLPMDVAPVPHTVAAQVHFGLQLAGMLCVARSVGRVASRFTYACSAIAVVGGIAFLSPGKWGLGSGVTERLALDTLNVWTIGMGVLLLARSWNPGPGIRGR
ncbi:MULTISPECIES: DUF998 domain-containing protein [unclassified Rhodococcus (in: high G+C Gram-positive bacteria)]|uniref:DUF998 domain-containing protein n=1 Tax=unclassified Rhodococcus (in: high G+C Gram-positive bacteria) TaxID=192944 RepID=UPI001C9B5E07|nr:MULTISPECIES: DUF998 domain-containing protein [unclassified Rhodococcus (in: high G+C Gram-positive bacteria)]MBY6682139.1 DUF998 domain-containing protein [Rhodococcus sp. BP-316]MBY6687536.1 DUF998 domain-containing protein [Rhodococcus sp. BP-288]MBY6695701.1 DUF998 domain-containing protein [Rhodococcus sp. BP-188]MBY6700501.1 DUF998 domain-containing protein [Rhodococcus sp. BP-285]MBY6704476.1 DUF998 domain-containing protein [Rhodococcus sp. BP-283]